MGAESPTALSIGEMLAASVRSGALAAVSGDETLLRQAMLMDPLTGAVCNPPEVWQMVDEMLVAQEQWLPQYGKAVADAKRRLSSGKLLPTKEGYRGAARLHVKTAEEMQEARGG